jgi:eukaryotic-like serine/threonine-protein kinase
VLTEVGPGVALSQDRYVLERLLGAGGMATVWLAVDRRLERRVAVKVLSDALAVDDAFIERFEREARLAAGLSHPNLVAVYDFGNEGRPYLVMEHIDGPTLGDVLRLDDGPGEVDPVSLARALMSALDHIHRAGIVHRDVKPSNVLLGDGQRIRLTDFGIAQPESGAQLTLTGQVMGTLRYLAPEVKAGDRSTPRSDLYASGILLRDVLVEPADPALSELVRRLCQEEPALRPASAAEALAALPGAAPGDARRWRPAARTATQPERHGPVQASPIAAGALAPTSRHTAGPRERDRDGARSRSVSPGPLTSTSRHTVASHDAGRRARPALALISALAVVVVLAVLALGGSGHGGSGTPRSSAPPAGAPLLTQLDGLDRAVRQGAR